MTDQLSEMIMIFKVLKFTILKRIHHQSSVMIGGIIQKIIVLKEKNSLHQIVWLHTLHSVSSISIRFFLRPVAFFVLSQHFSNDKKLTYLFCLNVRKIGEIGRILQHPEILFGVFFHPQILSFFLRGRIFLSP